jgi:hypothetical protein
VSSRTRSDPSTSFHEVLRVERSQIITIDLLFESSVILACYALSDSAELIVEAWSKCPESNQVKILD